MDFRFSEEQTMMADVVRELQGLKELRGAQAAKLQKASLEEIEADPELLQRLAGDTLALVDEAEEDVLRADVIVVEHARLFLRKHDHPASPVGEPFEHGHDS